MFSDKQHIHVKLKLETSLFIPVQNWTKDFWE